MKHILLIITLGFFPLGQVYAQEVTYWVGQSENPDLIMRHHEAFMDAFMKYLYSKPKDGDVFEDNYSMPIEVDENGLEDCVYSVQISEDSCRLQTVASITTPEGIEFLTILIGDGPLVTYSAFEESYILHADNKMIEEIMLKIVYNNTAENEKQKTTHEYYQRILEKTEISDANEIKSKSIDFHYTCSDTKRIVVHN